MLNKEQIRELSDEKILSLVEKAQGHTGKEFKEYMNLDCSYTFLTLVLKERGYVCGWYKKHDIAVNTEPEIIVDDSNAETIKLVKPKSKSRMMFTVDDDIVNRWKRFTSTITLKSSVLGVAMNRLMDDVAEGKIKVTE